MKSFENNAEDVRVRTDAVTSDSIPQKIGENLTTVKRQELDGLLDNF